MTDPQNPQQPPSYETPAYSAAPPAAPAYGGYPAPAAPVPGKTLGIVAFVLSFFVQLVALILGIVAFLSILIMLFNLIVDISYGFLDPRIRYE